MTLHQKIALSNAEAVRLTPLGTHSGMDITIQNLDSVSYAFIGAEGVTLSDFGFRIAPGQAVSFELPGEDSLYAISDVDGTEIAVLKTNLETGM